MSLLRRGGSRAALGRLVGCSVALFGLAGSAASIEEPPADLTLRLRWIWTDFGEIRTPGGLAVFDADGDGKSEIFSDSTRDYDHGDVNRSNWFVLSAEPALRQIWASLPSDDYRRVPRAASTASGSFLTVIRGTNFEVLDSRSFDVERVFPTATPSVVEYLVSPLTPVGSSQLVACGSDQLRVHDFSSGEVLASSPIAACDGLAVGQCDSDAAMEIVVSRSAMGIWILDGGTLDVEWSEESSPAWSTALAQISPDASLELVYAGIDGIRALEPETGELLWHRDDLAVYALAAGEVLPERPGTEIVVAGPPELPLQMLDAATGQTILVSPDWDHESYHLAVADVAGDSNPEIVIAAGNDTPEREAFLVVSPSTLTIDDSLHSLHGPFTGLTSADVDSDGIAEIVMSPRDGGSPLVLNVDDRIATYAAAPTDDWTLRSLGAVGQLDGDSQLESCTVICASCGGDRIRCEDLSTFEPQWEVLLPADSDVRVIELLDLDADASLELLVATSDSGIYAFEGSTGWLRWRTPAIPNSFFGAIDVANFDADPELELIAGGSPLTVFRASDGSLEHGPFTGVGVVHDIVDLDGSGAPEVIFALPDHSIHVVDPTTGQVGPPLAQLPYAPRSLRIGDLDRDGASELAVVTPEQALAVWPIGSPAPAWQSSSLGYLLATRGDLEIVDSDRDAIPELIVDTGFGFALFEGPEHPLLIAGFESGDTSEWSSSVP
jgi:outer membrane protein assembly factor BamB